MQLRDYFHTYRIKKQDFARKIGYSIAYIGKVSEYLKKPSLRMAQTIESATNGEVSVDEILNAEYKKQI